jgi:glycosyltransferase involved in cell wall biosynthesis
VARGRRVRIAHVVAQRVEAPRSGYAMRTWTISTALASVGELVIVNVGSDPADRGEPTTIVLGRGRSARYVRVGTGDLTDWFAGQGLDVVVADETALAPWTLAATGAKRIVNCQNVESEIARAHADRGSTERRALHAQRARGFELIERTVFQQCDQVWVASRSDADTLAAQVGRLRIRVVPNVVPDSVLVHRAPEPGHGVFFGSLWYEANQDAVTELLDVSDALDRRGVRHHFTVAGVGAPPWLISEIDRRPAVAAAGFVTDLDGLLARASGAVFPVTYGGGSMVKLVAALGAGCPVVTTAQGARGIPELEDGANVVIRPLGEPFVDAVSDLIAEPHRYERLGRAGARLVRDNYSLDVLDATLAELLRDDTMGD